MAAVRLTPIRSGLELVRLRTNDTPLVAETLALMERQIESMVRLVDDLHDAAQLVRGRDTHS